MKTISRLRYFLYLSILIVGCTTGKKALEKGNYDASVSKSVDRLRSSPKNEEAKQVLAVAYDLAIKDHLRKIDEAKLSADIYRWESVLANYEKMNQLSDEIYGCPACLLLVPNPQKYNQEMGDASYQAAQVRVKVGDDLMKNNNRVSAKKAYFSYARAQVLYPQFNDIKARLDDSYWAAVLRVVVQPVKVDSRYYQMSNQYFQQQVSDFMANYHNKFVLFYTEQQAVSEKIKPDQFLRMSFDDFVVGQTYIKERVEKIRRDSVVIGNTRTGAPIYGTVKATLSIFDKKISSSGLLALTIIDAQNNKIIKQRQLTGSYLWEDTWASYKGDDRALSKQQLQLAQRRESSPPPPTALFVEFTKPIYAQLVDEISYFYNSY